MSLYDRDWYREEKKKEDAKERFNNNNSCNNNNDYNKNSCCSNKSDNDFINFFKDDNGKWSMFKICLVALPIGILCPALIIPLLVIGGAAMLFANDWMNDKFNWG